METKELKDYPRLEIFKAVGERCLINNRAEGTMGHDWLKTNSPNCSHIHTMGSHKSNRITHWIKEGER